MKRLLTLLLALLMFSACASAAAETIVTSFYPIYLLPLNLTDGLEGVTVVNMAPAGTGCLHDYQLQTGDMKALAEADAFLINGAGMEGYLSGVFEVFPELTVVDASVGVPLLEDCTGHDHDHGHEENEHDHTYNAHIWLDVGNVIIMVNNLADGLMTVMPEHAPAIAANRDAYIQRLTVLDNEIAAALADVPRKDVITFHESFPYFANAYGLNVAAVISREPDDPLSPREMGEMVELVEELGTPPLFVEPQYEDLSAQVISRETGAGIYTLDPVVTGPEENVPLTYYEDVMRANLAVLLQALGE